MTRSVTRNLDVRGATLHYKIQGEGPLLLLLQGGDGDADGTDAVAAALVDRFTVLSYDRRGLSRSPITDGGVPAELSTHAEDVSRLLAAVTDQPALIFGTSIGALIGLDVLARHPEHVRLLVAHEPPATELLPQLERARAVQAQLEVEALHRSEGVPAAMRQFMVISGFRPEDREPGLQLPAPKPERVANLEFFLTHDAPAVRRYRLDLGALRSVPDKIVPAAGRGSAEVFAHHCAQALAQELGRPLVLFPGGHSGAFLRPREFAERLGEILGSVESEHDVKSTSSPNAAEPC